MKRINNERAPQFQPDYLISWDFSDADLPTVTVCCLERDKKTPQVVARFLGRSHEKSGVISLRQLIEYRDAEDRWEKEREVDAERLRRSFGAKAGPVLDKEGC